MLLQSRGRASCPQLRSSSSSASVGCVVPLLLLLRRPQRVACSCSTAVVSVTLTPPVSLLPPRRLCSVVAAGAGKNESDSDSDDSDGPPPNASSQRNRSAAGGAGRGGRSSSSRPNSSSNAGTRPAPQQPRARTPTNQSLGGAVSSGGRAKAPPPPSPGSSSNDGGQGSSSAHKPARQQQRSGINSSRSGQGADASYAAGRKRRFPGDQQQQWQQGAGQHKRRQQQQQQSRNPATLLTSQLNRAESPQELLQLLQDQLLEREGGIVNFFHVAAAYYSLGKLCQYNASLAATAAAQQLLQQLQQLLPSVERQMDARGLSNIIWSCAYTQQPSVADRLLPLFLQPIVLSAANAFDIANAMYGAADSGVVLEQQQLQPVLTQFVNVLPEAVPQGIANTLWAVATMQQQVPVEQATAMVAALLQQGAKTDPQAISNSLWGLGKMECRVPQQQVQQLLAALCIKLERAQSQHISNSLLGVAYLKRQVPEQQLQQLLEALSEKSGSARSQHIANSMWAVATMGQQLPERQLQQLLAALVSKLAQDMPQDISNSMWAVATMGQQVPERQLQQLLAALVSELAQASPQAISNSMLACAEFKFAPLQLLAALQQQSQLLRVASTANAQDVANTAWACGVLGLADESEQLLTAVLQRAMQLLGAGGRNTFTSQGLCNVCWAVAVLDLPQHVPDVLRFVRGCVPLWDSLVHKDLRQLYQVHLWLQDNKLPAGGGGQLGLSGVLNQQQLDDCRSWWVEGVVANRAADASQLQQAVFNTLQQLPASLWQQQPALEQLTADGNFSIDIVATTAAGVQVAIEVDGPWHYVAPGNRLEGPTQSRDRALAARGYTVVSVPHWEWDRVQTAKQRQAYLLAKLTEHLSPS